MMLDLRAEVPAADYSLAMSRPAEAARILEHVRAADPADQAVLEHLARAYFEAAQLAWSVKVLTRLLDLDPSSPWARRALARTLERQSRRDDATVHRCIADGLGAA